jgi:hypothetical protein
LLEPETGGDFYSMVRNEPAEETCDLRITDDCTKTAEWRNDLGTLACSVCKRDYAEDDGAAYDEAKYGPGVNRWRRLK